MAENVPALDITKPHSIHQATGKVQVYDQNGHLYDGITHAKLDHETQRQRDSLAEKYAIVEGAPHSTVKTVEEKVNDVIATIRASGAVDPDTLAKFDRLFKNMLVEQKHEVQAALSPESEE